MMLLTLAVSHVHFHRAILSPPYPRPPARRPARPPAIWVCVQQHVRRIWLQSTPFHSPHRVRWLSIFVPKPSDQKLALNATLLCPHLPFALQRARPIDRWNISLSAPRTTLLRRSLLRSFAQSLARGVASHCSLAVWRCCSLLPLRPLGLACALSGSFAASCAAERSRLHRVRSERPIRKLRRQVAPARHEGGSSSSEPPLHRCHVLPLYRSWLLTMANRLWTRSIGCGAHGKVDALALALAFSLAANTRAENGELDERLLSYLEAENEYCEQYRRTHLAALQRSLVREMNSHTEPEAFSVPERVGDLWYYLRYPSRSNHPVYCRATVLTRYLATLRVLPRQCARALETLMWLETPHQRQLGHRHRGRGRCCGAAAARSVGSAFELECRRRRRPPGLRDRAHRSRG